MTAQLVEAGFAPLLPTATSLQARIWYAVGEVKAENAQQEQKNFVAQMNANRR